MPLNRPTIDVIYSRIKADMEVRLTGNIKLPRFSMLSILAKVFAGTIHLCYGVLVWLSRQLMPDTAETDYLDRHAALKGLTRKAATYAQGVLIITGVPGIVIADETIFIDENGNEFFTAEEYTLDSLGAVSANIEAVVAGAASNSTGTTMELLNPIVDVDSVAAVTTTPQDGATEETDDELRTRLLFIWQNPPSGGRASDYIQWATEVAGVGKAWILSAYNGPGTVGVIIADPDNFPVSASILTDTNTNIDNKRPLGVLHTTLNLQSQPVDYLLSIPANSTSTVQASIERELLAMHNTLGAPGGTITLSNINTAITSAGLSNYTIDDILVNNIPIGINNIVMQGINYPRLTTVTYGTL